MSRASPSPPRRHRIRSYSLRMLLLGTTLCCIALATWRVAIRPYQLQEAAAKKLEDLGANIRARPAGSVWLAALMGKEHFFEIIEVDIQTLHDGRQYSPYLADIPSLETLRVGANFTDEDIQYLKDCRELRRLFFKQTQVTDTGFQICNQFKHLRIAVLGRNITDEGLAVLADKHALAYLDLSNTQITDAGLKHIEGLPTVHKLFTNGRPITDNGLRSMMCLPALDELYLVGCNEISDAAFRELKAMTKLRQLDVSHTQISDETVHMLRESLASCRILREYRPR